MRQHLPQRTCLHCAEPLSGRADKKFCDNSCKARYHRAASPATAVPSLPPLSSPIPVLTQFLLTCPPFYVLNYGYVSNENPGYSERYGLVYDYQEKYGSMHADYASIIVQFLCCQFDDITFVGFDNAVEEVTQAIRAYSQHPGLQLPGHIAHHRLADLYLVYSLFQALH